MKTYTTLNIDTVRPEGESLAVAAGKAIIVAVQDSARGTVDVERGDKMSDSQWGELSTYLHRRGYEIRGGVAYAIGQD